MTRSIIQKGPDSWNVVGGTLLRCAFEGGKYECDIYERTLPSYKTYAKILTLPTVDNVFVSKGDFVAGTQGNVLKHAFWTKTHCEIRGAPNGKKDLVCGDPNFFSNSSSGLPWYIDNRVKELKDLP